MIRSRTLVTSLLFGALFSSLGTAQDLSKYRDFQFGMRLESVARQIHMDASAAKTTHKRPAVCGFSGSFTQGFSQSFTHPRYSVPVFLTQFNHSWQATDCDSSFGWTILLFGQKI